MGTASVRTLYLIIKDEEERWVNIKLALSLSVVALLFAMAEHLGRMQERTDVSLAPDSTALVSLTLSLPERPGIGTRFSARFRLSNRGNHSIFYPVSTATNIPMGQLVARTTLSSDWMSLSKTLEHRPRPLQEYNDPNLRWIEMPPGGWADGEFSDPGDWAGEHAYRFSSSRNGTLTRFGSCPNPMVRVGSSQKARRFALRTSVCGVQNRMEERL